MPVLPVSPLTGNDRAEANRNDLNIEKEKHENVAINDIEEEKHQVRQAENID